MKKSTLSIFASLMTLGSLMAQPFIAVTAPPTSSANGTSGNRGPNGTVGHTVMRGQYFVPAGELSALSPTVSSFGFALTSGVSVAANGTLTVYLQNTSATSYTAGTTWNTSGMTQVYSGNYNIPAVPSATTIDFPLSPTFTYTAGMGLNVAYEYTATVTDATPAIYTCWTSGGPIQGATGASGTISAPVLGTTAFRPLYRFGSPNTYTNEISVNYIPSPQVLATRVSTSHAVTALVSNNSNTVINGIGVGLGVSGAVTHTALVMIPTLASGASTLVTFSPYTYASTLTGVANVSVSVLADQNNSNNLAMISQNINCNGQAAGPDVAGALYGNGIGFNTGQGLLTNKMTFQAASTLTSVAIAISTTTSNLNNGMYAVVSNSTGSLIATSNTINISNANLGTYTSFTFATPVSITANTDYYIGVAQPSNSVGYFPVASYTSATNMTPPNTLYSQPIAGGAPSVQNSSLGFLGIKAMFQGTCTSTPTGISEVKNNIVNLNLYPNPAKDILTVSIANVDNATIDVINALGQVVLTVKNATETNTVNIANLAKGVYFVTVSNGQQKSTQKLVVEK
ncbi:MAG: T9SS type A sorting domain-containing protein [Bacteroidetes bacterium]|nr:T9SS type A sorting domain-containing protein [Bacteroidota bacterium]